MSEIKILPDILSNKIAAGEVVERPASVVKELVENALDAGSDRIIIDVEQGGRSLIRVSDNGTGMNHDDALLCIERYATSKIRDDSDLFSIRTLGFRGEALPSIASVSRFTLETRDAGSAAGLKVYVEGGKIKNVSETGCPVGTQITVDRLFFNTPARRKFLKTVATEMGHIGDTVSAMALSRATVQFKLIHNNRPVKIWTAVKDPIERAAEILGVDAVGLLAVHGEKQGMQLTGFIASPRLARATSRGVHVFVNGRCVRDRTILHALFEGYQGRLMKGRFPAAVVFITLDPSLVDVNVHPAKHEVRFSDPRGAHQLVAAAVSTALDSADRPQARPQLRAQPAENPVPVASADSQIISERVDAPYHSSPCITDQTPHAEIMDAQDADQFNTDQFDTARSDANGHDIINPEKFKNPSPPAQESLWRQMPFEDLTVIGRFKDTYILCESEKGLLLIDQHAAHERILYERLKKGAGASAQRLLMPETIEPGYGEAAALEKLIPELTTMGIEIEPFGGNTFVVKSVPSFMENRDIKPLILEMAEKAAGLGVSGHQDDIRDAVFKLMACHAAVRANQPLQNMEIRELLRQLDDCDNPSHCPHGRPLWILWSHAFLEKSFGRLV